MGKATANKAAQIQYLENRVKLLSHVVAALNREAADENDLKNILTMLDDLKIKVKRFHDDWASQD
ncbi:hypothetical protein EV207_12431 [Scopulibacillus darangshiensis]|uniref:Uncharacterized protein n=1 Tax=Scopulibacillus darangshiensis TaxID=442528 RepID=A0A4R2NS00_9BACL|nr:SE1561 family protein [Scopulibacillus darangshiensis]TCP24532.1 hypothetical protein EV207_12431 [Scopulibacillus darangshiensis]